METKDVAWLPGGLRHGGWWPKRMVQAAAATTLERGALHDPLRLGVAVLGTAARHQW